jgi:hypothetical protein
MLALAAGASVSEVSRILHDALRTRREETARECLATLGRGHGAVHALAKVLAVETGLLAEAAAAALGATRLAAAEPSLVKALSRESPGVRAAAARALGKVGGASAVPALKEAAERHPRHGELTRAVRQAIAEIQARLAEAGGAAPGQLSLAGGEAGQVSLAEQDTAGRLSLAAEEAERAEAAGQRPPPGTIQGKT